MKKISPLLEEKEFVNAILTIQKDLYVIAKIRMKNEDDACDVMQETMLAAYKNRKKVRQLKYLKTWMVRILINNCNKLYRTNHKVISLEDYTVSHLTQEEKRRRNVF